MPEVSVPPTEADREPARRRWSVKAWWADLPLRGKGVVVVALPVVALVAAPGAFLLADQAERRAESSVTRTLAVNTELARTLGLVVDAESGARGFLLTREDPFLEPYLGARRDLPGVLDRLDSLISDADQKRRLAGLRPLIDQRLALSDQMRRFWADAPPGELVTLLERGKATTDQIRARLVTMEQAEADLLARRRARADHAHGWALAAAAASAVLGLLGGIGAMVLFTRGVARRVGRLEEDAGRLEQGLPVAAPPAGGDEVGRVGRSLARASELLRKRETALRQAQEAADAANRSKSEFLSRMSHELRTPLNAVLGFGQLLELEELTAQQSEAVVHILKGGRHLLDLIDEVLDISRIETGRLPLSPEPVLVSELLRDTVDLIRPLATQRSVHLLADGANTCQAYVFADRQRLKQILLNLLSNAVKYNRSGGTVTVSCGAPDDSRLRINVTDTGPGIGAEHLALLFLPFERLGAERTDTEGTGIGLALSRRLAEAMGGTLDVVTTLGQGSTFWVELPLVEGPVERYERLNSGVLTAVDDVPPTGRGHTVLYIEDNLSNLELVERVLAKRHEVEVIAAMQGGLGLELARQHRPALILLDLHLPDMGGDQVLHQLRDDPATAAIPVIMVSADATPGQIQRLLAAGAIDYLTKPLDVRKLLRLLAEVLAGRED
jgi:signal transduction histidine kinase/ActR/RegA family two-component response regulator